MRTLCARQAERGQPVTLLMLDLDYFKTVNDRFGHATGDEVLRVFAGVARSSMRANDIVGRLGGEEFAVIVPEGMEFAVRIAERLRAGFEEAGVTIGEHAIGATVSVGAAASSDPLADIDALFIRADAALYRAKNDGRNRVYAAEDEPAKKPVGLIAARSAQSAEPARLPRRKTRARRAKPAAPAAAGP